MKVIIHLAARELGRRGGLARARRLSPQRRKIIAISGAKARLLSLRATKRIEENFRYLEAVQVLGSARGHHT